MRARCSMLQPNGRAKLNVEKLHALGEPKSLKWLRERVEKMLPKIDLPDLLFEVNAWTGFLDAFVHLGDGTTRMKDLPTSVVALSSRSWRATSTPSRVATRSSSMSSAPILMAVR